MNDGNGTRHTWPRRWRRPKMPSPTPAFSDAAACLAAIVVAYCYEVVARYFFNAPTSWASALASNMRCAVVFLATPELTRKNIHIVINVLHGPDAAQAGRVSAMASPCWPARPPACSRPGSWGQWLSPSTSRASRPFSTGRSESGR